MLFSRAGAPGLSEEVALSGGYPLLVVQTLIFSTVVGHSLLAIFLERDFRMETFGAI